MIHDDVLSLSDFGRMRVHGEDGPLGGEDEGEEDGCAIDPGRGVAILKAHDRSLVFGEFSYNKRQTEECLASIDLSWIE